jgi:uncharacterized protein (TIGR03437 family)
MGNVRIWMLAFIAVALASRVSAQPVIAAGGVVNATGYQAKLAPDTVFLVRGSALGASSIAASAPNYATSLGGTSITFTPAGGGAAINAKILFTGAEELVGLLPSSITPGSYNVRVIYNSQASAPQNVTVVARSFGIATANGAGSGTAQATIGNVNGGFSLARFTSGSMDFGGHAWTLMPAHPGDMLVFWGSGGGADPADIGGTSGDQTAAGKFMVTVGDRQIVPQFAGTSPGSPGLWQVTFTLPADITPDCFAPAQVSAGGELGNRVSIPIAAFGQTACVDPTLPPAVLAKIDAGGELTIATFGMFRLADTDVGFTTEGVSGAVYHYSAAKYALTFSGPRFGPCTLYDRTFALGSRDPASPDGSLDAGARLPFSGPSVAAGVGLISNFTPTGPVYLFLPPAGTFAAGGQYTLTGNGGTQVGSFSTSTMFPSSFTVTNWDSITVVDRTNPLTINWTGSGFDRVYILVTSSERVGTNEHITTLNCSVPGTLGTYSVPPEALAGLVPAPALFGTLSVQAISAPGTFTATLASGGETDLGLFGANLGVSKSTVVQ